MDNGLDTHSVSYILVTPKKNSTIFNKNFIRGTKIEHRLSEVAIIGIILHQSDNRSIIKIQHRYPESTT